MPHRGGSAIKTSREEVKTMDLDSGIREIAQAILAFPTAAMLLSRSGFMSRATGGIGAWGTGIGQAGFSRMVEWPPGGRRKALSNPSSRARLDRAPIVEQLSWYYTASLLSPNRFGTATTNEDPE